ncbi:hypothetical protein [Roseibium sediminicola]|uniref:Uncharacterized protein n=1 Tax=Roseibium sediminicola TaxID=2933272 RepID=A0ABT0H310_9HYPH|nr:hypothetical protein [Roseibium sp. CAU 1639]MCK7616083.1 hypothetical protein [Roseibium sp. CAU 1639]
MQNQAETEDTRAFWNDVDPKVVTDLNAQQKQAIYVAVQRRGNARHAADIRLSLFGYFLVVLFGRERRSQNRLKNERTRRPVVTFNNLLLIAVLWGSLIYTLYSLLPHAIKGLLSLFL